ncbi:hypothetical protein PACTADRAFT_46646 [Pachysolen tannophilus NRRL Y-2460]|uniref:PQ-loop repeat-containing protein 1 n=1 Tax=Pachysolen tannophilus NRRL Y-2460 TaxID=669874 RepID=A0A1E4TNQ3_PACTA|nr:hypothetical protein PACTADRAFT_46646 [Pachysolen tannophilus NRRL Y-2460]
MSSYLTIPADYYDYFPSFQNAVNSFMIFSPLISYGTTILGIYKQRTSTGFSIDICATMLMASILKVFYYINEPFEISLLRQCFIMIFIQCLLLKTALKFRPSVYSTDSLYDYPGILEEFWSRIRSINGSLNQHNLKNFSSPSAYLKDLNQLIFKILSEYFKAIYWFLINFVLNLLKLFDVFYKRPFEFWQWEREIVYWKFLASFIIINIVLTTIFYKNENFTILIGSASLLTESLLPLPQILIFQRLKSVKGFKTILLLSWLGGDFTKISYLIYGTDNVSIIFIIAAFFQFSLNCIISFQFFYYKELERRNDALNYLNNDTDFEGESEMSMGDGDVIELNKMIHD